MRFTRLGVGHLEYKACAVYRLTVEDEPNWSELCSVATAAAESDLAVVESDDETDLDDTPGEDLNADTL
jgi:hypothetical protein